MNDAPIVPNFDDDDEEGTGRKLVIIASKGNLDMAYPPLILAAAALGEGIETHIFFTFWGFDIINKATMKDLQFTPLGNTAMHMPQLPKRHIPQSLTGLPGMTQAATKMMKAQIAEVGIPTVPEMLDQIVDMGGHLWACRMSFDMMKLTKKQLYKGVEGVISASDFMDISAGAQTLFV